MEVEFYREIKGMFVGGSAPAPRPYSQGGEVFQGEVSGGLIFDKHYPLGEMRIVLALGLTGVNDIVDPGVGVLRPPRPSRFTFRGPGPKPRPMIELREVLLWGAGVF